MPNINNIIDTNQQNLNTIASHKTAYFSTLDLKYAYSQLKLDPETTRHCNFNIISGEGTGTYRFISGFYGLTDTPAAFQNVMDYTLVGLDNTHCFIDDIIVVSRGSNEDHLKLVYECFKKLDADNLRINLPKCQFAKIEIEWLGHKFTQSGIEPLETKTAAILNLTPTKNLKQLRSFLGSVHYLSKLTLTCLSYAIHFDHCLKRIQNCLELMNSKLNFNQLKTKSQAQQKTRFIIQTWKLGSNAMHLELD